MDPCRSVGDGGDASRRYLYTPVSITQADNECRLEGDKTHEIFHFLSKKSGGGHFLCGPHQAEKWGGTRPPPVPHRSTPVVWSPVGYSRSSPVVVDLSGICHAHDHLYLLTRCYTSFLSFSISSRCQQLHINVMKTFGLGL